MANTNGLPVPKAPLPIIFYAFFAGINFVCLLVDTWMLDAAAQATIPNGYLEEIAKVTAGFYYRKELTTPTWFKSVMLALFVMGVAAHVRLFVNLLKRNADSMRLLIDAASICLYGCMCTILCSAAYPAIGSIYFSMAHVRPMEKAVGEAFLHEDSTMFVQATVGELQVAHIGLMLLYALMSVGQVMQFKAQHRGAETKEKGE